MRGKTLEFSYLLGLKAMLDPHFEADEEDEEEEEEEDADQRL